MRFSYLLLGPRRESACPEDILHLPDTREKDVSCHEPLNAFLAGRTSQAPFVRPELAEAVYLPDSLHWVDFHVLYSGCIIEVDRG